MRRYVSVMLLVWCACAAQARYYDGPDSGGFLTDSNNWSAGVFDAGANPTNGTSTGDSYDLIAGDRSVLMIADFATFDRFTLGTDNQQGKNVTGAELLMSGGTLSATNFALNPNNVATARVSTVRQSGGDVIVHEDFAVGQLGPATYTISGGSFYVGGDSRLNDGQEGLERTFAIEGQDATDVTMNGDFFAGAGTGIGYQNIRFKLGPTGVTPLTILGSHFADEQTEYIIDGTDYTNGVGEITLLTSGNFIASQTNCVQTFINFGDYLPELLFTNKAVTLKLTENPNPELLVDGSFEGISGNEPNADTAPWFTNGENADGSFITETVASNVLTGVQSVKFTFYFDDGAVVQNVDKVLESGEFYEFSVWNIITEPSSNPNHTNASTFNMSIWTSPTNGGTYVYRQGLFGNIPTNEFEYQEFTYQFSTAQLVDQGASLGDYIQVRIAKANANSTHKMCFDDASFKTIDAIINSYSDWASGWGVDIGGESEDYDNDGQPNLYEYGQGGNPTNGFVNGNLPVFANDGVDLTYTYAQRTDDPTLEYYLETTESLTIPAWTNAGYAVVATNVTGGVFDYVTNSVPAADDASFIRLIIEN